MLILIALVGHASFKIDNYKSEKNLKPSPQVAAASTVMPEPTPSASPQTLTKTIAPSPTPQANFKATTEGQNNNSNSTPASTNQNSQNNQPQQSASPSPTPTPVPSPAPTPDLTPLDASLTVNRWTEVDGSGQAEGTVVANKLLTECIWTMPPLTSIQSVNDKTCTGRAGKNPGSPGKVTVVIRTPEGDEMTLTEN